MENASKALIIAGSILIAIVLVSVGVLVVNSLDISNATGQLDQTQIQEFNSRFEASTGTNVTGTATKQLITTIMTNNSSNSDDDSKCIYISYEGAEATKDSTELTTIKNSLGSAYRYTVEVTEYQSGLYHVISISKNS